MKKIIVFLFLALFFLNINAQNIEILQGAENKIPTKKAEFSLIGYVDEKLILLEKDIDNLRAEFYLHLYDKKNNFKLIRRVKLDLGEKELSGFVGIGWIGIVSNKINVVLINKSKDETQKKYFASVFDLDLKQDGTWKELLNLKLPGFKSNAHIMDNDNRFLKDIFFDWQDLYFHYDKKVLSIKDESIPKKVGSSFSNPICFDLNFNEVACIENNFKSSSPSEDKKYPFLFMTRKIAYSKNNFIIFSVRSNKDEYSSQNKAKHSVNLILVNKDSSYGYRSVAQLPKGYEIKIIDGYYNSVKDVVLFYALYKEKKDRKNEYSGILIIKYDLNTEKISSEVFNPFKIDI